MRDITNHLIQLSDKLDKKNKTICANAIDNLIKTSSLQKVAQYVGVIGYVLKQERAMSNCIRRKRATTEGSMQEVIMDCLKEYQDGQDYQDNEWTSKYASSLTKNPGLFKSAHVEIIDDMKETVQIESHLDNVQKTANILNQHGENDILMEQILGHYDILNGVLDKDLKKNFKLAQHFDPKSKKWTRSWWNRTRNPDDFKWWNPFSYNEENRERGSDASTVQDIKNVLLNLTSITQLVQGIKTDIYKVKNEAQGYTPKTKENMHSNVPPGALTPEQGVLEPENNVDKITAYISNLDPSDWNSTVASIQQLNFLISDNENSIKNTRNQDIVNRTYQLVNKIDENIKQVYQKITSIQELMTVIPTRNAILGRDFKFKDNDETNPRAIKSPMNEFLDVQSRLEKLYENPFDSANLTNTQRSISRLWDKLRYMEYPDEQTQNQASPNNPVGDSSLSDLNIFPEQNQEINDQQTQAYKTHFDEQITQVQTIRDLEKPLETLQQMAIFNPSIRESIEMILHKLHEIINKQTTNLQNSTPNNAGVDNDDMPTID